MLDALLPQKAFKYEFKFEEIRMKESHTSCPIWINYDGLIILETFTANSKQATDFLIAIAEPVSRPVQIHEYRITSYSLYAAVSVGLTTEDILSALDRFSKNHIPSSIRMFIEECTLSYGKIHLIFRNNRFFIETFQEHVFSVLVNDPEIGPMRLPNDISTEHAPNTFEISAENIEKIRKRCIEIDYPMIEEYDFRDDTKLKNLDIDLRDSVHIRTYQEVSLNKMFGNRRARSGIIVLPCGSGKTLVGITAIRTIMKPCIILCTSCVSVEQWRQQILTFTTISPDCISRFTSERKEIFTTDAGILITTYTMLAFSGKRSYDAKKVMDWLKEKEWGLMILDEVHVVPAMMFRKVISIVSHHCKLGLTATLVREDDKIEDLNFLIGPKLYEADWQDLSNKGHIAKVECVEVWCEMSAEFYREYLSQTTRRRRVLSIMNPKKFQICEFLIKKHEAMGEKVIVFSDNVLALKTYALKLGKPFIYGPTGQAERMRILKQFQTNPLINTIFLSKVGDTSIDLPEASCLIQISSHFGSRRQEAQRLGRILRAKKRNDPGFRVFFYSLVSKDTEEMYYSNKRQQFLIDQGYTFQTVTTLDGFDSVEDKVFRTKIEQKELLATILLASEVDLESEESDDIDEAMISKSKMQSLSGAEGMAYLERNKPERHSLFKKMNKKQKK